MLFTTTPTETLDVTDTATVTITATSTTEATRTETTARVITMSPPARLKRQETGLPTEIPKYATACSGIVRYRSACDCLGAGAPATVTVAAPSTTVTVSETLTPTTVTVLNTVTTDTATLTKSTRTVVRYATTTQTTTVYAALPTFQVQLSGPVTNGFLARNLHDSNPSAIGLFLGFTNEPERERDSFTIDDRGVLIHVPTASFFYASGSGFSYVPRLGLQYRDDPETEFRRPIRCSVQHGNKLMCADPWTGRSLVVCGTQPSGYSLIMLGSSGSGSPGWGNCRPHELTMVNI